MAQDPYAAFSTPVSAPVPQAPRQSATQPRRQPAQRPRVQFADDRDAAIRTLIGEADGQPEIGVQAVAGVIRNRAASRGQSVADVVTAPYQFEPWGAPESAQRLMAISPNDPRYIRAAAAWDSGIDPTNGADHFYAPGLQAALGRDRPSFDNGTGRRIGDHLFFDLEGSGSAPQQAASQVDASGYDAISVPVPREVQGPINQAALDAMNGGASGPRYTRDNPFVIRTDLTPEEAAAQQEAIFGIKKGDWIWEPDGTLYQAGADVYADPNAARSSDQIAPGVFARNPNLEDQSRAFVTAAAEQVPFLDEAAIATTAALEGREYSDVADEYRTIQALDNQQNRDLRVAGGITGAGLTLLAPGTSAGGNFIARGAGAADRAARAALVGAGTGAVYGAGNTDGGALERAQGATTGALTGFGAGAVGQRVVDRLIAAPLREAGNARTLSRAGVELTPAQMLADVPVLGRLTRSAEQAGASIPIAGTSLKGAEQRSVASFDRTAINRALEPLNEAIPRGLMGRDAIRAGDDIISARYQEILDPITIAPDPQINIRIQAALNPRNLSRGARTTLQDVTSDVVARLQSPITGPEWKQIDSELSSLINTTANGDAASRPLSRALRDVRAEFGQALDNASPGALERVREADAAFGNFSLIRRAASNPTTGRNDGLFTPSNLNSVLARSEGRAYGRGEGRLQELVDPAEAVMAGTLNNSGTAERVAMTTAAMGGAGTATLVNPGIAIPVIAGVSALYSRPAQAALNAVYRATDSQTANEALTELARLAQRTPALLPYYEDAAQRVLQLTQTQSPASPQGQQSRPSPTLAPPVGM